MSSKVLLSDDPRAATPLVWQQVHALVNPASAGEPDAGERLAQLEHQCQERIREAHAAGLREGEAAGRSRAQAELQPVIGRLARSIEEIAQMRPRMRREAEADVVRLALAIARRVVRRELAVDPDALRGLVLAALEKLQGQEIFRVKVHPSHAALVTACLKEAAANSAAQIIADPGCEPGGLVFETERGNLDASMDSQLQEIERGLVDRLKRPA